MFVNLFLHTAVRTASLVEADFLGSHTETYRKKYADLLSRGCWYACLAVSDSGRIWGFGSCFEQKYNNIEHLMSAVGCRRVPVSQVSC